MLVAGADLRLACILTLLRFTDGGRASWSDSGFHRNGFAHQPAHSPTRLATEPSVLTTDILSGRSFAFRTRKHPIAARVSPRTFTEVFVVAYTRFH